MASYLDPGGSSMRRRKSSKKRPARHEKNLRFEALEERIVLSVAPPTIEEVLISGQSWRTAFVSRLAADNEGSGGYRLTSVSASAPLPWSNLDRLSIRFNEGVNVQSADLRIQGVDAGVSIPLAANGFQYNTTTFTATWTFAQPLAADKYAILLGDDVTNGMGARLDGDGAPRTGDGVAGGDFVFQFAVVPGDGNQDGVTNMHDGLGVRQRMFANPSSPNYSTRFDFDGSGAINILDGLGFRDKLFNEVPIGTLDLQGPTLNATLQRDTAPGGLTNVDRITSDPMITGAVSDPLGVGLLTASVDGALAVPVGIGAGGAFTFSPQLALGGMSDGSHLIKFVARDAFGNPSQIDVTFTLDTQGPAAPALDLSAGSGVVAPQTSNAARVTLVGATDPNISVALIQTAATALSSNTGGFQFASVPLNPGPNSFTAVATDVAGNSAQSQVTIQRIAQVGQQDPVLRWNQALLDAVRMDASAPTFASRSMAMVQAAVYDTVAAIEGRPGYYVALTPPAGVSLEAAVSGAAYHVLSYLYPGQQAAFDAVLTAALAQVADGAAKSSGVVFGQAVGEAIIALRANDGWKDFVDYASGSGPGAWQETAPMYALALDPQWADLEPFAMTSPSQFLPPGPPSLTSEEWATDYNEIKSLGAVDSATRSADQTQIARFWADGPGTSTPAGHWNFIAEQAAIAAGNSIAENARLFAELNIALGDAAIVAWNAKYDYEFWRPITAIHAGDTDDNDVTVADPAWSPFLISPPFPEYVSGHSTFSAAAAAVLTSVFGDDYNFSITSNSLPGVTRSFTSFKAAAEEAGRSRIYGGIHYEFSNQDGQAAGNALAAYVLGTFTTATDERPPNIIIDNPQTGQATAQNLTISGRALDNVSGVYSLEAQLDGGAFGNLAFNANGNFSYATSLALDGVADGPHVVRLRATDFAHNTSSVTEFAFTLDTLAPALAVDLPVDGAVLAAGARLTGMASGTGSPLSSLTYTFDGGTAMPFLGTPESGAFDVALDLMHVSAGSHVLSVAARDAAGSVTTVTRNVTLPTAIPLAITSFTPVGGANDVGSTFRPQVFFSRPVNVATLNDNNFYATDSTGSKIPATIVPAADGSFAWLFFTNPMTGAATITVHVVGDSILAKDGGQDLDGDGDGNPGGALTFHFTTVSLTPLANTSLYGKVLDPGVDLKPMTFDDIRGGADGALHTPDDVYLHPIAGVKVFIIGLESQFVYTDVQGNFTLPTVPAGDVKLAIDGRTATNAPTGVFFPEMVMDLQIQVGQANTAMGTMGTPAEQAANLTRPEVYLPRLQTSILHTVSNSLPTMIGVDAVSAPDLTPQQRQNLQLEVQPGSLIGADGQPLAIGQVGIATVPPELVREMLPPGLLQHAFDITIQAPGVATFSTPVQMSFPNVFNSAPGTKVNFLSFNHTTGRLEIDGTATVSADGLSVHTDPDTGITHPGWHGLTPPGGPGGPKPAGALVEETFVGDAKLVTFNLQDRLFTTNLPDKLQGLISFGNAAANSKGPPLLVNISVDKSVASLFLDGFDSQSFALLPGETQDIAFHWKPTDITKLKNDALVGISFRVSVDQLNSDGSTKQVLAPSTYYLYHLIDASDGDPNDGRLEFPDTLTEGDVERTRNIEYLGTRDATPTLMLTPSGDFNLFPSFAVLSGTSLVFDPATSGSRTESLSLRTPAPTPRTVGGPGIVVSGNGVSKIVVSANLGQLESVLEQLADDNSATEVAIRWPSNLEPAFFLGLNGSATKTLFAGGDPAKVQKALEALPNVGAGNAHVTFSLTSEGLNAAGFNIFTTTYTISFSGQYAKNTPLISVYSAAILPGDSKVTRVLRASPPALTVNERALIDTPEKRAAFAQDVLTALRAEYAAADIEISDAAGPTFYNFDWTTSTREGVLGNGEATTLAIFAELKQVLSDLKKYNPVQQSFVLAAALNKFTTVGAKPTVFVNNLFQGTPKVPVDFSRDELINLAAGTAAHELGHTLGLVHTGRSKRVADANEVQTLSMAGGTANDTYMLLVAGEPTTVLHRNATAADVQLALRGTATLAGNAFVSGSVGGPYTIRFVDPSRPESEIFEGANMPQILGVGSGGLLIVTGTSVEGASHSKDLSVVRIGSAVGSKDLMNSGHALDQNSFLPLLSGMGLKLATRSAWKTSDALTYLSVLLQAQKIKELQDFGTSEDGDLDTQDHDSFLVDGRQLALLDADGLIASDKLDFGDVPLSGSGSQPTRQLTLLNFGSEDVVVRGVRVSQSADQFSVPPIPVMTLHPGESFDFEVTFHPNTDVPLTGILTIDSDAVDFSGRVELAGVGHRVSSPVIRAILPMNNFGGLAVGELKSLDEINFIRIYGTLPSVRNDGDQPLTITNIRMAPGRGQEEYTINYPLPVVLQPGKGFTFNPLFRPSGPGLRPGVIEIMSNDPLTPLVRLPVVGTGLVANNLDDGNDFVAVAPSFGATANTPVLRTRSDAGGNWEFFLPAQTWMQIVTFDPASGLVAHGSSRTNASGQSTEFNIGEFVGSGVQDTDGDGLPDDIEFAVGTSTRSADSDGDGIGDFDELRQGLNPLDGRPTVTGIVAGLKLDGQAQDIVLGNDPADPRRQLAYIATFSAGLAIVDITSFDRPLILSQLDLSDVALAVDVDPLTRIAAVAAHDVVHFINVADPARPQLLNTFPIKADHVVLFDGLAYLASGNDLIAFDPVAGEEMQRLSLGAPILEIRRDGAALFVLTDGDTSTLHAVDLSGPAMAARGSLTLSRRIAFFQGDNFFVADGVAWLPSLTATSGGLLTVNVRSLDNLSLISDAVRASFLPYAVALNGSGLGIALSAGVTPSGGSQPVAYVVDTSDPNNTAAVFTQFTLPDIGQSVAVASGLAFVADQSFGLQIINYLAFDQGKTPPTITPRVLSTDIDPGRPGIQMNEASTVTLSALITDDVQIRNVELLVDGIVVRNEVSYPYDLTTTLPTIAQTGAEAVLQIRATDTGGNVSLSEPIVIELVPDNVAPTIVQLEPVDGSTEPVSRRRITIHFSESLNPATVTAANFELQGPTGVVAPISVGLRQQNTQLDLFYAPLAEGNYQLVIHAPVVTDRVGNALGGANVVSSFRIASIVHEPTSRWTNPAGGFWDDAANWQDGRLPGPADDVLIDMPGDPTITFRQGSVQIRSLVSENPLRITGGKLVVSQTIQVNDTFTLRGASSLDIATLNGTVLRGSGGQGLIVAGQSRLEAATIETDMTVLESGTRLRVAGGLTLIGTCTLGYNTAIGFEGSQDLPSGTFVFDGLAGAPSSSAGAAFPGFEPIGSGVTLTIGKDVVLRGYGGIGENKYFFGTMSLVNRGTITADINNQFFVTQTTSLTNEGTIQTKTGGNFQFNDKTFTNAAQGRIIGDGGGFQRGINLGGNNTQTWSNAGLISATNCVISFTRDFASGSEGRWSNTGTILNQDGVISFYGRFTSADVQNVQSSGLDIQGTGAGIRILGEMDNTGREFTFNSLTGSYLLFGTIRGGTLNMGGPAARLEFAGGKLDGVTINGDLGIGSVILNVPVTVTNGLTLNGTLKIYDNSFNRITFQGDQTVTSGAFVFEHSATGSNESNLSAGLYAALGSTVTLATGVNIRSNTVGGTVNGKFISYATITSERNGPQQGVLLRGLGSNDEFINRGTIRVNPGAAATGGFFVNEGAIIVDRALQFSLGDTWHNRGTIDVTSSLVILGGTFTTADIGNYRNPTGQTALAGTLDNSGKTLVIDGTTGRWSFFYRFSSGITGGTVQIVPGGSLASYGGVLKDVTVQGDLTGSGDLRLVGEVTIHGMVDLRYTFSDPRFSELFQLGDDLTFRTLPLTVHAGTFDLGGRGYKTIQTPNNFGTFSGAISFGPDVVLSGRNVQATFVNPLLNQGAIIADLVPDFPGDNANTFTFTSAPITNEGRLEAKNGGNLTVNNLVTNRGTIAARTGSIVNVGGNLPQEAIGTVAIDIGGQANTQFGQVMVAGVATLAGTLNVNFVGGYVPNIGDRFQVLTYASQTGAFATVTTTGLPAGVGLMPVYNATNITLVAVAMAQPVLAFATLPMVAAGGFNSNSVPAAERNAHIQAMQVDDHEKQAASLAAVIDATTWSTNRLNAIAEDLDHSEKLSYGDRRFRPERRPARMIWGVAAEALDRALAEGWDEAFAGLSDIV